MPKDNTSVYQLNISEAEALDLLNDKAVTINASHKNDARVPILLTKTQIKNIEKAVQNGSGFALKFTPLQHELHTGAKGMVKMQGAGLDGMGFWSRLWGKIKKVARGAYKIGKKIVNNPITKPIVNTIANLPVVKEGIDLAKNVAVNTVAPIAEAIKPGTGQQITDGANSVSTALTGSGMRKKGRGIKPNPTVGPEKQSINEVQYDLLKKHVLHGGSFRNSDGRI